MRIIVLSDDTTLEIRQEIFNRINTTGREAKPSEIRRGSFRGPFMDFLMECTKDDVFKDVCPISETMEKRYEQLELVIRFFAFWIITKNLRIALIAFWTAISKILNLLLTKRQ